MQDAPDVHLGAEQAAPRRELLPHQLVSRLPRQHDCVDYHDRGGFLGQHLWPVLRAGGAVRCGWVASESVLAAAVWRAGA